MLRVYKLNVFRGVIICRHFMRNIVYLDRVDVSINVSVDGH